MREWINAMRKRWALEDWDLPRNRPAFVVAPSDVFEGLGEWVKSREGVMGNDLLGDKMGFTFRGIPIRKVGG